MPTNYEMPTAERLWEKFRNMYSKTTFPEGWLNAPERTKKTLDIFEEMGGALGFETKAEWLLLDQTWEIRRPNDSLIALAFEHENFYSGLDGLLVDELQKLIDVKSGLKVLMFYPPVSLELLMPDIIERILAARHRLSEENYLILSAGYEDTLEEIQVEGFSVNAEGKSIDLGSFSTPHKENKR